MTTEVGFRRDKNLIINPFHATALFLYPLKKSENLRFSDIFMEVKKKISAIK